MASEVVLAFFENEAAADAAVVELKAWDKLEKDVKLGAIGILALNDQGKVKTQKLGSRSIQKGAGIGLLLALLTPATAGIVITGGIIGALHHKGLGLTSADRERIAASLSDGKAAVGVLAKFSEGPLVAAKLAELGGIPETHAVSAEDEAEVDAAVEELEAAVVAAE